MADGSEGGTLIKVPVYAGIRGREPEGKKLRICWSLAGVDYLGHWKRELAGGEVAMKVPWLESGIRGQIEVKIPEGIKGAWLFAWITDRGATLCEHDVQFEVEAEEETDPEVFLLESGETGQRGVFRFYREDGHG